MLFKHWNACITDSVHSLEGWSCFDIQILTDAILNMRQRRKYVFDFYPSNKYVFPVSPFNTSSPFRSIPCNASHQIDSKCRRKTVHRNSIFTIEIISVQFVGGVNARCGCVLCERIIKPSTTVLENIKFNTNKLLNGCCKWHMKCPIKTMLNRLLFPVAQIISLFSEHKLNINSPFIPFIPNGSDGELPVVQLKIDS